MRSKISVYFMLGFVFSFFILYSCGNHKPSLEEQKKIEELKIGLNEIENEIKEAEIKDSNYAGGLIKALIEARIEILKTNKALIEQRINALESGAAISLKTYETEPDLEKASRIFEEIEKRAKELELAKKEASEYSGGLILAMKQTEIVTQEQTIAMLKQRYLILKYGLDYPQIPTINDSQTESDVGVLDQQPSEIVGENKIADEIISVKLLDKRYSEQDYQDYIFFDIEFKAIGLDKATRAIKGILNIQDLFCETMLRIGYTIEDPLNPGGKVVEKGSGFEFNQFMSEHNWVRSTRLQDMRAPLPYRVSYTKMAVDEICDNFIQATI